MFFRLKSHLFWGLFVFCNALSFLQVSGSTIEGEINKRKLAFAFTLEGEYFDSTLCIAERYAIYKKVYHAFETNPLNFKNLDKGPMVLQFISHDGSISFDSIVLGATPKNKKTMNYLSRDLVLNAITNEKTILIELYIRKSNSSSCFLDTLDLLTANNKFSIKTATSYFEKGQLINKTSFLDSILRPFQISKKRNKNELYVIDDFTIFPARFRGGENLFIEYLEDYFVLPPEIKDDNLECKIITIFTINKEGLINKVQTISHSPSSYADKLIDQEVKRILQRSPRWIPKKVYGQNFSAQYCLKLNIYYVD